MRSKTERIIKLNKVLKFAAAVCIALFFVLSVSYGLFGFALPFSQTTTAYAEMSVNEYGFADGDGSENNPFIITTPEQLSNMRNYLNTRNPDYAADENGSAFLPDEEDLPFNEDDEDLPYGGEESVGGVGGGDNGIPQHLPYYFALGADIDLKDALATGGTLFGDGKGWLPIGDDVPPNETKETGDLKSDYSPYDYYFYGVFDGCGYSIRNLWLNRPEMDYAGLFGYAFDSKIIDFKLYLGENGIIGRTKAGGVVGNLEYLHSASTIEKCAVYTGTGYIKAATDDIDKSYICAGGFAGAATSLKISNSYFEGSLQSDMYIGGLIGSANKVSAKNCFVIAAVTPLSDAAVAGGLIGSASSFGMLSELNNNHIERCFADISATSPADAFAGEAAEPFDVTYSYYAKREFITADGNYYKESVSGLNPAQLKLKSSYIGFDFSVWGFDSDNKLILREFGKAYDPPAPPNLLWLYITLPCLLFAAAVITVAIVLYRRKKPETITVTNTITEVVEKAVEVPIIKKPLPSDLTKREKLVAQYILQGLSRPQIADTMSIGDGTVKTFTSRIYIKCGVENQKEFIARYLSGEDKNI